MWLLKTPRKGCAVLSDERVTRLGHAFRHHAGRAPQGGWSAPGRVNLIGEHTDYNDGLALPFAIDRQTLAAVALRDDDELRCWSLQDEPDSWLAYPRGVRRALVDAGVKVRGADIVVDSDVPSGGGLSSSAALECAVALALNELAGGGLDRMQLARACQSAENTEVGAQTGIMDQVASLLGAAGSMLLFDVRSGKVTPLPAELDGLELLVIDTSVRHTNAGAGYSDRRRECAEAAELLGVASLREAGLEKVAELASQAGPDGVLGRRARHVFTENVRVTRAAALLRSGRARDLGPLLNASHASLRDDFEVSAPELDVAVDAATQAGALGARMVGGGFGGSVLALVASDTVTAVRSGVDAAYGKLDWPAPTVFPVTPSEGARRFR
ncbi:MAG: galactokinase [Mycobacterium sp.]|nr:galactokinase [Mycobacterium sp.]